MKEKNQSNKKKKNGFTLVELLAALVILGLLTAIAAPNIVGIMQNTKVNTYVSDANKLISLAQYSFRGNSNITKPTANNECISMKMSYLGTSEFKNPPYGGEYDSDRSYVLIKKVGSTYEYYVQLVEKQTKSGRTEYSGIKVTKEQDLNNEDKNAVDKIESGVTNINTFPTVNSSGKCSFKADIN